MLLATEQEPAVVSLVTESDTRSPGGAWTAERAVDPAGANRGPALDETSVVVSTWGAGTDGAQVVRLAPVERLTTSPLCVTPCAVDLPVGAHRLLFKSVTDKTRKSEATIGVSEGTLAVRHTMAETKPMQASWLLGFMGAFVGAPLTLGGVSALAYGTLGDIEQAKDARSMQVFGGVTLALGAALLTGGIFAMDANRGSHREAATTTFPVRLREARASRD